MSARHRNLNHLINLAKEPSSERRRDLLREMTELFMEAPSTYSETECSQFGDILGMVARDMEMAVRQNLAARLSNVPNAPRNLVLQLASDEIPVARPMLLNSLVLKDSDLIALAKLKSQDHLHAIAGREHVSSEVSDALVARGDDRVLVRLADNAGAQLSREAMETLTERANNVEALQRPMVTRHDLPPDLLNSMFFAVTSELKRAILERMGAIDPAAIDAAIRQIERRMKRQTQSGETEQASANAFIAGLQRSNSLTESMLVTLSKQKRFNELVMVFAKLTELDLRTARRVLEDPNLEALAITARACRFDRQTFSTLALNRADETRSLTETYELLDLYDKIPTDAAQRVMRFWRVRHGAGEQAAA